MAKVKTINLVNGIGALSILKSAGVFDAVTTLASGGEGALGTAIQTVADSSLNRANQTAAIGTAIGVLAIKSFTKGGKVVGKLGGLQFTA